jgi:hypothetical protein
MDLYIVETPAGPALCKYRYLIELQLADQPDRYRSFTGPLSRLHATQGLEASFSPLVAQRRGSGRGPHGKRPRSSAADFSMMSNRFLLMPTSSAWFANWSQGKFESSSSVSFVAIMYPKPTPPCSP